MKSESEMERTEQRSLEVSRFYDQSIIRVSVKLYIVYFSLLEFRAGIAS